MEKIEISIKDQKQLNKILISIGRLIELIATLDNEDIIEKPYIEMLWNLEREIIYLAD